MLPGIILFSVIMLIAILVEPLAEKLRLPFSSFLVLLGFLGSEAIVALGFDTGFRWHDFVGIILHVLVPIIIFESAFNANTKALLSNFATVMFLAIPAMLIAAGLTGGLIYYGIGSPDYFPLTSALLAGIILSATDPVAVVAMFKKLGAPDRLNALLEGESLYNDATAIVVYTFLIALAVDPGRTVSVSEVSIFFLLNIIGGTLTGLGIAWLMQFAHRFCQTRFAHTVIGIITLIISFYVADHVLLVSGVVSVLSAGLLQGHQYRQKNRPDHGFTAEFWELNAYVANAILFVLAGVTITVPMFTGQWLAMVIGIAAAIIARLLVIYGLLPVFTAIPNIEKASGAYKHVMMWGGLRGAVSLALALSLPTEVEGWFTIQSIVYGVVVFTLFVQAPFMERLVKKTLT